MGQDVGTKIFCNRRHSLGGGRVVLEQCFGSTATKQYLNRRHSHGGEVVLEQRFGSTADDVGTKNFFNRRHSLGVGGSFWNNVLEAQQTMLGPKFF